MKMKLIRIITTEREYAIPVRKYSDLPCFRIEDGQPVKTAFTRGELCYMLDIGSAEVVGEVTLTLTLERKA